jgi:mannan endo-1,4-beta-mannosidase
MAACSSSGSSSPSTSSSTSASQPNSTPTTANATAAVPPPVPASGSFLGAWLNPTGARSGAFAAETQALPGIQAADGRPLTILHVYVGWSNPGPTAQLQTIDRNGSLPILDWGCPPSAAAVVDGADDAQITTEARSLKSFGRPLFLRWCWEMNLAASHPGVEDAATFVSAWQHIWTIFQRVGAANVSFVWCPALSGRNPSPYYPGNGFVDWIGVDGYDHTGTGTFASVFGAFYADWSSHAKPMMVVETGSPAPNQAAYLDSVAQQLPTMPLFKGFVYFDAVGPTNDWRLGPAGLAAFAQLARNPYFVAAT